MGSEHGLGRDEVGALGSGVRETPQLRCLVRGEKWGDFGYVKEETLGSVPPEVPGSGGGHRDWGKCEEGLEGGRRRTARPERRKRAGRDGSARSISVTMSVRNALRHPTEA